jgi:hypothetical protein
MAQLKLFTGNLPALSAARGCVYQRSSLFAFPLEEEALETATLQLFSWGLI